MQVGQVKRQMAHSQRQSWNKSLVPSCCVSHAASQQQRIGVWGPLVQFLPTLSLACWVCGSHLCSILDQWRFLNLPSHNAAWSIVRTNLRDRKVSDESSIPSTVTERLAYQCWWGVQELGAWRRARRVPTSVTFTPSSDLTSASLYSFVQLCPSEQHRTFTSSSDDVVHKIAFIILPTGNRKCGKYPHTHTQEEEDKNDP